MFRIFICLVQNTVVKISVCFLSYSTVVTPCPLIPGRRGIYSTSSHYASTSHALMTPTEPWCLSLFSSPFYPSPTTGARLLNPLSKLYTTSRKTVLYSDWRDRVLSYDTTISQNFGSLLCPRRQQCVRVWFVCTNTRTHLVTCTHAVYVCVCVHVCERACVQVCIYTDECDGRDTRPHHPVMTPPVSKLLRRGPTFTKPLYLIKHAYNNLPGLL